MTSHYRKTPHSRLRSLLTLIAAALISLPGVATAQQYFDPGLFQSTVLAMPPDYQPPGARVGSFVLNTGAELGWYHNDNVFYSPEDGLDDNILSFRPRAEMRSDWNRHALNFGGWADISRFSDFDVNDYEDWALRADGRVDVKQGSWFSADAHYMNLHEDRRTPDSRFGLFPTEFDYSGWGAGYDHTFNRLSLGFYYNYNQFDYDDNVNDLGEPINNDFRDREQNRYNFRANYQISSDTTVFARYGFNDISYDIPDQQGRIRDSDGWNLGVGARWNITDLLTGDLSLNYSDQSYDDPTFRSVDGWNLGAGLTWTPRPQTVVNVRFAGGPVETIQPGTGGYFSQLYSIRWQEELRRNLLFQLRGSFTNNDYANPGTDDFELAETQVYRGDIALTYLFNRHVYASAGYMYETQDSNERFFEYTSNRYFVVLGLQL